MPAERVVTTAPEVDECILNATSQVLEKMFFTCFDTTGSDDEIETNGLVHVEIVFSGPLCGRFRLKIGEDTVRSLGSTLTCMAEDEFARDGCVQVAGELANMICGSLLSQLEPEANLSLSSPSEIDGQSEMDGSIRRWFCLPEGALAVEFALAQVPCLLALVDAGPARGILSS